jgi:hypothetical protein
MVTSKGSNHRTQGGAHELGLEAGHRVEFIETGAGFLSSRIG